MTTDLRRVLTLGKFWVSAWLSMRFEASFDAKASIDGGVWFMSVTR